MKFRMRSSRKPRMKKIRKTGGVKRITTMNLGQTTAQYNRKVRVTARLVVNNEPSKLLEFLSKRGIIDWTARKQVIDRFLADVKTRVKILARQKDDACSLANAFVNLEIGGRSFNVNSLMVALANIEETQKEDSLMQTLEDAQVEVDDWKKMPPPPPRT